MREALENRKNAWVVGIFRGSEVLCEAFRSYVDVYCYIELFGSVRYERVGDVLSRRPVKWDGERSSASSVLGVLGE